MGKAQFTPKEAPRARRAFGREELEELLDYNPSTGVLTWKVRRMCYGGGLNPGSVAGTIKDGYRVVLLFGRQYRAHHLAWLFMTGEWPPQDCDIDHINVERSDNRWANLRLATRSQNNLNASAPRKNNTSGHRGVHKNRTHGWFARITVDRKVIHLGCFAELGDAVKARRDAEIQHFGEYAT